ncbi:MAG: hypothetical protein IT558_06180 [Alphaproteobacteria bacterium]|nr:hypothetical protein [Alphaproteobacteria bacterium]
MIQWFFVPYMAWVSRMCGGAPPPLGRPYTQILYAIPLGLICLKSGVFTLAAFAGAYFGKSTGHGQWMSLAHVIKKVHEEPLDFIVTWFWGPDPRVIASDDAQAVILSREYGLTKLYWRCVSGLVVVGTAVTIIPALIFGVFVSPVGALLLLISGALKGPAYMIGWKIYPTGGGSGIPELNQATQIGEFLTGLFTGVAIALAWPF